MQSHKSLRTRHPFLWVIICINLWGFAVIGPVFFLLGVLSFWIDLSDSMGMFGQPVDTLSEKIVWIILTFLITCIGILFAVWHVRTRRRATLKPGG